MKTNTKKIVLTGLLMAIVIVFQYFGNFIRFGPFSISLVLIPIVVGAVSCGLLSGAFLGLVFGAIVLLSGQAAPFFALSVPGTIVTVLVKGAFAGYAAGLVYKLFSKKNETIAAISAAVVCPIVNTGVFLIGCLIFFKDFLITNANGGSVITYMLITLVGINFLIELFVNVVLCPIIVRLMRVKEFRRIKR